VAAAAADVEAAALLGAAAEVDAAGADELDELEEELAAGRRRRALRQRDRPRPAGLAKTEM